MDDVFVDGGSCTFLSYILLVSWSLPNLRVGSLKPLLVGSKRTLAGSSIRVEAERSEKIEVFHITTSKLYLMVFINRLLSFHSHLVSLFYVIDLLL